MQRNGDWIYTHTGHQFWMLDPQPEEISIEDIAHALSNCCRFAGHVPRFYSVAEHSVHVSKLCEHFEPAHPLLPLYGLLHDASEAYLCDIPRPLKIQPAIAGYREVEALVQSTIYKRFGLGPAEPRKLKVMDNVMLTIEMRDLFPGRERSVMFGIEKLVETADVNVLYPLSPPAAKAMFLARFKRLYAEALA